MLAESGLSDLVPSRELAFGIVALYVGVALLARLSDDRSQAESLFESGTRMTGVLGSILGPTR